MWDLIVSVPDHCLSFYFMQIASFCLLVYLYTFKSNEMEIFFFLFFFTKISISLLLQIYK